jgi:hypothetical protein
MHLKLQIRWNPFIMLLLQDSETGSSGIEFYCLGTVREAQGTLNEIMYIKHLTYCQAHNKLFATCSAHYFGY